MTLANLITLARLPLLVVVLGILLYTVSWGWQLLGTGPAGPPIPDGLD